MGKQPQPTQEELEFVYRLIVRGLGTTEIGDEMQGTEFPLRTDGRYFAQRRRELNRSAWGVRGISHG